MGKLKKKTLIIIGNFIFFIVAVLALYEAAYGNENITMYIEYSSVEGVSSTSNEYFAQMFYAEKETEMSEKNSVKAKYSQNEISFDLDLSILEYQKYLLRFDPLNEKANIKIKSVVVKDHYRTLLDISGSKLKKYVGIVRNAEVEMDGEYLRVDSTNSDPQIIIDTNFNQKLINKCLQSNLIIFNVIFAVYILWGIIQIFLVPKKEVSRLKWYNVIHFLFSFFLLALGGALVYGENYLTQNFDDVPLGQLIYHLHTPLDGTNTSTFSDVIVNIVLIILGSALVVTLGFWVLGKLKRRDTFLNWCALFGTIEIAYAVILVCVHFDAVNYFKYVNENTSIYEDNYVDGKDVNLTFPQKKQNLVYIFMESMEMTYADSDVGGAMSTNYIPELTELALENESFSSDGKINGAHTVPGATFTTGGLVAQTSGVPINETIVSNDILNSEWESENNYVPGVWAIGDVLDNEGYNQEFMIGSDGKFAGRSSYFSGHGGYSIFDYYTAIDKGYIPSDYVVWWGYEDKKLFEYAKEDISDLAQKDEPFNFTMLTVDTHFTGGYLCDLCGDEYQDQYSNVISCASRQVTEFVDWLKEQDFYEDTTIVIAGDHLTMDSDYINRRGADEFDRKTYFTIINGKAINEKPNIDRIYTTLDLYPTTLAAMGVNIEGNKLGLGTNLYSGEETLIEKYGEDYLDVELLKDSKLYRKKILYAE